MCCWARRLTVEDLAPNRTTWKASSTATASDNSSQGVGGAVERIQGGEDDAGRKVVDLALLVRLVSLWGLGTGPDGHGRDS